MLRRPIPEVLRRKPRLGRRDRDVRQRLRTDHDKAIGLEAKADLTAYDTPTAKTLIEANRADTGVDPIRNQLEVDDRCAGREQRKMIREHLTRDPLCDIGVRDRPGRRDPAAPDPSRYAGRRIPRGVPRASSLNELRPREWRR